MGRRATGWKLLWRGAFAYVRFTHAGTRHFVSTGETDPERAHHAAATIYADTVAGKRRTVAAAVRAIEPLPVLFSSWLESLEGILDPETIKTYKRVYVRTHFLPFFASLDKMDEASIANYGRKRLREVMRKTVHKELGALRTFLVWAKEQGLVMAVPPFPEFPRTSRGVRVGPQRQKARALSSEEVERVLEALPEKSLRGQKRFPVWARFVVAFETTLRPATLDALRVGTHWRPGSSVLVIRDEDDKARLGREVPLSTRARAALTTAAAGLKSGDLIFGKHDYRPHLKAAAKASGVPYASVCSYDLRHARITDLVERTGNLPGVMHLAGHTQIGTTSQYTHPSKRAAEAVLAEVSGALPVQDEDPEAVRRKGLEPLQELPHWNLNAAKSKESSGKRESVPAQEGAESGTSEPPSGACTTIRPKDVGAFGLKLVWDSGEARARVREGDVLRDLVRRLAADMRENEPLEIRPQGDGILILPRPLAKTRPSAAPPRRGA